MLQTAINNANKPSQIEQNANTDYTNTRNFLNPATGAPDYRDPLSKGVVTGMLSLDDYHKQRNQLRGMPSQSADTTGDDLASRQTALADNQFDQDYGSNYQDVIGGLGGQNANAGMGLINDYNNRNSLGVMGAQAGLNAVANRRPSLWSTIWPSLLHTGAQVGMTMLGNAGGGAEHGASGGGGAFAANFRT